MTAQRNNTQAGLPAWAKIALIILAAALIGGGMGLALKDPTDQNKMTLTTYFIDIDGDGDLDYVQSATVILNCGGPSCVPEK